MSADNPDNAIHLDREMARVICEGAYTLAHEAISTATTPTLQLAAQLCEEAANAALAAREPYRQYADRAILCRSRRRLMREKASARF